MTFTTTPPAPTAPQHGHRPIRRHKLAALALALSLVSACTTMEPGTDVATAWAKRVTFAPEFPSFVRGQEPPAMSQRYPVVIFMHGCSGIEDHAEMQWGKYLRELGFIVVIPDSLARRDRHRSCDGATATYVGTAATHRARQQEIDEAYAQVANAPWAQKDNIFLMGHSEGGIAAALTPRSDFRGIIISGWTCTTKYRDYAGIHAPASVPVLSLLWKRDRWYPTGGHTDGTCEASLAGRPDSKHITLDGFDHTTAFSPIARAEVKNFLLGRLTR